MKRFTFIAIDPEGKRREWLLELGRNYAVGREPGEEFEHSIAVAGDRHLSRHHFSLLVESDKVTVTRSPRGRNPLFFDGDERDLFALRPGQVFYTGKTQFGMVLGKDSNATTHYTLAHKAKEEARLRRLEDCFNAVLELLKELRVQNETPAWQVAFPVLRSILPEVDRLAFLQLHGESGVYKTIDRDPEDDDSAFPQDVLQEASQSNKTVTAVWDELDLEADSNQTLSPNYFWTIASPVKGLERSRYLLCVAGKGSLQHQALEERATLVDLVCEMVGHHIVIRQGSEYSSLLGVFGHHVGTLFKTSGALELWSQSEHDSPFKNVMGHLLPIWGISQAISLHKKRGEKEHQALLETWVKSTEFAAEELEQSLYSLVAHAYYTGTDEPFLPWKVNGKDMEPTPSIVSLPPLDDVPHLFDKTLALAIGLIEMLSNVRKYPSKRGTGREDRQDLAELEASERVVQINIQVDAHKASIEVDQPVVTTSDGSIPRSKSLQRIRALEQSLLGALVGTEPETLAGKTSVEHVVRVKHKWNYHFGQLMDDWKAHFGS